jgi:hypothetical protein
MPLPCSCPALSALSWCLIRGICLLGQNGAEPPKPPAESLLHQVRAPTSPRSYSSADRHLLTYGSQANRLSDLKKATTPAAPSRRLRAPSILEDGYARSNPPVPDFSARLLLLVLRTYSPNKVTPLVLTTLLNDRLKRVQILCHACAQFALLAMSFRNWRVQSFCIAILS